MFFFMIFSRKFIRNYFGYVQIFNRKFLKETFSEHFLWDFFTREFLQEFRLGYLKNSFPRGTTEMEFLLRLFQKSLIFLQKFFRIFLKKVVIPLRFYPVIIPLISLEQLKVSLKIPSAIAPKNSSKIWMENSLKLSQVSPECYFSVFFFQEFQKKICWEM